MNATRSPSQHFSAYKELAKSGIVTLVLISVLGGYLAGHSLEHPFSLLHLLLTLTGVYLLASGSSALNQFQERREDAEMPRTANRPLPSGRLSPAEALLFVAVTLGGGILLLAWIGIPVLLLGLAAVVSYNGLYTMWWKRHWAFAAVPGAIPGALPILMGYASATGEVFTPGGLYLFGILFFWQMPHFWVLALRYRDDYEKGGFPTLPVALGSGKTVTHIVIWCLAYIALALLAPIFFPVGMTYFIPTLLISLKVIWELRAFRRAPDSKKWLHFFLWINFSLIVYIGALVVDLWGIYLLIPFKTR